MNIDFDLRRPEERSMLELRRLYELYGYRKYKVSNFEEYSLYLQYKKFLSGDKILSFTDLDGRLLALRPDVTLSIIKNAPDDETTKAYYIETVYRESAESNTFKEIKQMGLEFLGKVDAYAVAEVVSLAQQSLAVCGREYILELGHMGFVCGLLDKLELASPERQRIVEAVSAKSPHLLAQAAEELNMGAADKKRLLALLDFSGSPEKVLPMAEEICSGRRMQAAIDELKALCEALADNKHIHLDLSLLNATEFYDGVLMRGYLPGLPRPVLSGGRYDSMMSKLGRRAAAIGFAVYLDELERLPIPPKEYDVDVWLSPAKGENVAGVLEAVKKIVSGGESVRVADELPEDLRAKRHLRLAEGELMEC